MRSQESLLALSIKFKHNNVILEERDFPFKVWDNILISISKHLYLVRGQ